VFYRLANSLTRQYNLPIVSAFHPSSAFSGERIFSKPPEDISAGPSQFAISGMVEERMGVRVSCSGRSM
jgi:hypothetical protein